MSPENQGIFQLMKDVASRRIFDIFYERGEFSKNSGIFQLVKMGSFLGASVRGSVRSDWLVGLVRESLATGLVQ
jgi:hypothetical protein